MKKLRKTFLGMGILAIIAFSANCKSIERVKMADGKDNVVVHSWGVVFFTAGGAPMVKCLEILADEGISADDVEAASGGPGGAGISSARTSTGLSELCSARGVEE